MTTLSEAYASVNASTIAALRANARPMNYWASLDDSEPTPAPKAKVESRDYLAEAMAELNEFLGGDA